MEFHQLEYVIAVEKYKHFSLAADEINISQPTLSHQIKKLEDELGVELFIRTTRSVKLTPAGKEFVEYAKRAVADRERIRHSMSEHADLRVGNIKIGTVPNITHLGITTIIANFKKSFPGINIQLYENNSEVLLKKMHTNEIDVSFVNSTHNPDESFEFYPLIRDKFVVLVSRKHIVAGKEFVELSELSEENFIIYRMGGALQNNFKKLCNDAGFTPKIILESIHMETMKGFTEEEIGILLTSRKSAESMKSSKTKVVNLTPTIDRLTGLVVSKNNNLRTTRAFRDFILEHKHSLNLS